ncbi:DgyrCDS2018 [Dimorphilus gyrociliatus]|uniref:DgyrCDS2018 n=1 Tax=Dimorphilus gyrociliatus TaxID=2664684 RepID=A0A7I8V987_9ANNE|nr:DgyrCDS2018 [Dimorphilus gyrociliatus]
MNEDGAETGNEEMKKRKEEEDKREGKGILHFFSSSCARSKSEDVSEGAVASGEDKKKKKNMFSFVMPNKNKKTKEKDDLQGEGQLSDPLTWKKSFDTLLHDKDGLEQFRRFLTTEFSSENIEFWIACEEYREADKHELKEKAERIYEDFIRERSHRQVILNSQL